GQAAAHVHGDQGASAQQAADGAPQRLEPLGHALDGLAVEGDDPIVVQARRQRGLGLRLAGIDLAEPGGTPGQQSGAHGDGDPPQLAVGGTERGLQLTPVLSLIKALAAAATVFQEGIADQVDEQGEGENLLVTPAPVVVEDLIERAGIGDPPPQGQDGLGQGQAGQRIAWWDFHGQPPGKKNLLISSSMSLLTVRYVKARCSPQWSPDPAARPTNGLQARR